MQTLVSIIFLEDCFGNLLLISCKHKEEKCTVKSSVLFGHNHR